MLKCLALLRKSCDKFDDAVLIGRCAVLCGEDIEPFPLRTFRPLLGGLRVKIVTRLWRESFFEVVDIAERVRCVAGAHQLFSGLGMGLAG